MILGISGSGRKKRMVHQTIQNILALTKSSSELISLSGKRINGCIGCTLCARDNICKQIDDWNEIGEKMIGADVIIFGAGNYYGMINALAHACLERTFSFRHRGAFTLKNKLGVSVSTSREGAKVDRVKDAIQLFMKTNQMKIIGHVTVEGYDQCYTCGVGKDCMVGNVVRKHGVLEKIEKKHLPLEVCEQASTMKAIRDVSEILNRIE